MCIGGDCYAIGPGGIGCVLGGLLCYRAWWDRMCIRRDCCAIGPGGIGCVLGGTIVL
jgi:hypothetical protein